MPVRRAPAAALLLAVLLAAPAAGGAWEQLGGPERSGTAAIYPQLDVLGSFNATGPVPYLARDGPFDAPGGPFAVAASNGQDVGVCSLVSLAGNATRGVRDFACPAGAGLVGLADGLLLVCVSGDPQQPLLHAWRPDGSEAWALPTGAGPTAVGNGADPNAAWDCGHPAVDAARDRLVVPYSDPAGHNRVVAYRLSDRAPLWNLTLTAAANPVAAPVPVGPGLREDPCEPHVPDVGEGPVPLPLPVTACQEGAGDVRFGSASLTSSGVVLAGATVVASAQSPQLSSNYGEGVPFAAWTDLDGHFVGSYSAADQVAGGKDVPASRTPAVRGPRAALAIGGQLLVIDPGQQAVALTAALGTPTADVEAPAWSRDGLTVPLGESAWLCEERDLAHCTQWGDQGGHVDGVLGAGDGTAWFAVHRLAGGRFASDLVRVRLDDATTLERIPLPFARADGRQSLYHRVFLLPTGDGELLAATHDGDAVRLGAPAEGLLPVLGVDDDHPRARQPVRIEASPQAGAPPLRSVLVGWGDGLLESFAPGDALTRSFPTPGDREVRVTFVYEGNRTATAMQLLHVGQQRVPVQGFLGLLFGPEYQNYTFFAIGVLITVVGSVATALGVARGRKRIDRRLRELDRIQDAGRRDPFAAARELHAYRQARRRDLAGGHLDDTQYTVLEAHADRVLEVLRQRILGGFVGRVSEGFSHALDTALADGAFDETEARALLGRVDEERQLDVAEQERLRSLIATWQQGLGPAFVVGRRRRRA
jgi:hypothetical protein